MDKDAVSGYSKKENIGGKDERGSVVPRKDVLKVDPYIDGYSWLKYFACKSLFFYEGLVREKFSVFKLCT